MLARLLSQSALPLVAGVLVPAALCWWWPPDPPPWYLLAAGIIAILTGLAVVLRTIRDFARVGWGEAAPWQPPDRLVTDGLYGRLRNPMISGMALVLVGESLATASPALAAWTALFIIGNACFIPLVEEPRLRRSFGAEWEAYAARVPRFVPRFRRG